MPISLIAAMFLLGAVTIYPKEDVVIADFEGDNYSDWQVSGDAFGSGPTHGALPGQNAISGFVGSGLVNSFHNGDNSQGTLTSPEFTISRPYINFLIGGGNNPGETCVNLLVEGKVARTATGRNDERLDWATWDVSDLMGKPGHIQIVDHKTGGWGHILVDQIVQSSEKKVSTGSLDEFSDGILIADFERKDYGGWQAAGQAFGSGPAQGTFPGQMGVSGYVGHGLVNSFLTNDDLQGTLSSPEFTISRPYINFLIGGGNNPGKTCVNLLVGGKVVRTATGNGEEHLDWATWDVRDLQGEKASIEIVDHKTGGWGHILVDQIVQSADKKGVVASSEQTSTDDYRLQFHFAPEKNWCNDPNGMVYYDGEYHLFYQYNPYGDKWGHMSWGHAISTDLVHWQHLPVALTEENGVMIFSGSAVVDWKNTSGFGSPTNPPLVAIYTGHRSSPEQQAQCLAYSLDRGRTWNKYSGNPILDIGSRSFRDPKVFWFEPDGKWIMVVSHADEKKIGIYTSADLKTWTESSTFGPAGASGVLNWECPDLFQLPVEGQSGVKKWVLHVGVGGGAAAGGSGGQYFVGEFDGKTFRNDNPGDRVLWSDYGKDDYAAVSWSDIPPSDGRRLWLGWMNDWRYADKIPTRPSRGSMTIPRELGLRKLPDGIRLIQKPAAELKKLRDAHVQQAAATITSYAPMILGISGDTMEIVAEFALGGASEFGFTVRKGDHEETLVGYDVAAGTLFVDRVNSGVTTFSPDFPGRHPALMASGDGHVKMHIFVDRSSVEVFGNDGDVVITDRIFPSLESQGLQAYAKGGNVKLISLDVWKLNSIWK